MDSRAANAVYFNIEFKFEFELSLFYEFEFKFKFKTFIFASSSSSPMKVYEDFSSSENKVIDFASSRLQ